MKQEDLSRLTREELVDLVGTLEAAHLAMQREDIVEFARHIEIPGGAIKYGKQDLRKLLERKKALSKGESEAEQLEPEEDESYGIVTELAAHHELILTAAQNLIEETPVEGPLSNGHRNPDGSPIAPDGIMLFFPPGAAKSTYGSVVVPAWALGRFEGIDVINVSFAADLARRFGRRVRQMVRSPEYERRFNTTITGDNQAVDQWSLTNGSTYKAVGVLGGVTGNRADLVIIDDPIAGREEAESDIIREKTVDAIKDDVFTRLKPHGKVMVIQTRWHEADPAGALLGEDWEGQSGLWYGTDKRWWFVLCCPLVCERYDDPLGRQIGELLWPQWFTPKTVELAKAMGPRAWSSLYQQRPSASDGNILMRSWWRCWPHGDAYPLEEQTAPGYRIELPRDLRQCFLCYDTAIEDGEDNDFSAMTAWYSFGFSTENSRIDKITGETKSEQHLLLAGAWREKIQAADLLDKVMDHVSHFHPDFILIEKRASGAQLLQELRRRRPRWVDSTNRVHYVAIIDWLPPGKPGAKGKTPRAWNASTLLAEGAVWYLPGRATDAVLKECASFPNGKNDDWVDTVTMALIHSRQVNLMEIPSDEFDTIEEREREREEFEWRKSGFAGYGSDRKKNSTKEWQRRLYG